MKLKRRLKEIAIKTKLLFTSKWFVLKAVNYTLREFIPIICKLKIVHYCNANSFIQSYFYKGRVLQVFRFNINSLHQNIILQHWMQAKAEGCPISIHIYGNCVFVKRPILKQISKKEWTKKEPIIHREICGKLLQHLWNVGISDAICIKFLDYKRTNFCKFNKKYWMFDLDDILYVTKKGLMYDVNNKRMDTINEKTYISNNNGGLC